MRTDQAWNDAAAGMQHVNLGEFVKTLRIQEMQTLHAGGIIQRVGQVSAQWLAIQLFPGATNQPEIGGVHLDVPRVMIDCGNGKRDW